MSLIANNYHILKYERSVTMEFQSIMHVSFFAEDLEKIREFYEDKLNCKIKMLVRNKAYLDKPQSSFYKRAQQDPEGIAIIYFEVAPRQFVEFFPAVATQKPHTEFNEHIGYSHFSLLVEDIHKAREEFVAKGVPITVEPTIGNSHTWQMWIHDPEGNKIEVMQFTDESFQLVGHIDD